MYTLLEKDASAPITADEFLKAVRMVHPQITRTEARYLFTDMDAAGNGIVSDKVFADYWPTVLVELAGMAQRRSEGRSAKEKARRAGSSRTEELTLREKGLVREGAGYMLLILLFVITLALRRSVREIYYSNQAMHRQVTDAVFSNNVSELTFRSVASEVRLYFPQWHADVASSHSLACMRTSGTSGCLPKDLWRASWS